MPRYLHIVCVTVSLGLPSLAVAQESETRTYLLSFAQGALPLSVGGDPAARSNFEHAVRSIDGNIAAFS